MKCLYCHESIEAGSDACPQCGLPLNREITLMGAAAPPTGLLAILHINAKLIALTFLIAGLSGFTGLLAGWATSQPRGGGAVAHAAAPPPAPAASPVALPPPTISGPPVQAQAEPVVSEAIALTVPLDPVRPSAIYSPQVRWAYRPRPAAQRPAQPAPRRYDDAMLPPSPSLAMNPLNIPRQPYVYVSPVLATMGDVTVQITPARGTRSF